MDNNNIIHYTQRFVVCQCGKTCKLKNYINHVKKSKFHDKYLRDNDIDINKRFAIKYVIF